MSERRKLAEGYSYGRLLCDDPDVQLGLNVIYSHGDRYWLTTDAPAECFAPEPKPCKYPDGTYLVAPSGRLYRIDSSALVRMPKEFHKHVREHGYPVLVPASGEVTFTDGIDLYSPWTLNVGDWVLMQRYHTISEAAGWDLGRVDEVRPDGCFYVAVAEDSRAFGYLSSLHPIKFIPQVAPDMDHWLKALEHLGNDTNHHDLEIAAGCFKAGKE